MNDLYALKNTAVVTGNEYDPDLSNNTSTLVTEIFEMPFETDCIIVPKIFSSCQSRHYFDDVKINLPSDDLSLVKIRFGSGQISNQSILPLSERFSYARVIFDITIPVTIELKKSDGTHLILFESLPPFHNNIILYCPHSSSEQSFTLNPETRSELLCPAIIEGKSLILTVGTFLKIALTMPVQLQVKTYGYCLEPISCEEFMPNDRCLEFSEGSDRLV